MKFVLYQELLDEYNIPYRTEGTPHCRPGWINIDCPFCGKNTQKFHMGYSIQGNYCSCWRCGWQPLIKVVAEITNTAYKQAAKLIGGLTSHTIYTQKKHGKIQEPKSVGPLQKPHKLYLKKRGLDWRALQSRWDVKGIGIASQMSWSIFIPIHLHGNTVSWTTRAIGNRDAKYMSAPREKETICHKDLLFGEDYVSNTIIVTEGPFDVFKIGPGAVATFGMIATANQIAKMIKYPRRFICFDNEPEAQKRAKRLCDDLGVFKGDTYNIRLTSNDAGDSSPEEIRDLQKLLE